MGFGIRSHISRPRGVRRGRPLNFNAMRQEFSPFARFALCQPGKPPGHILHLKVDLLRFCLLSERCREVFSRGYVQCDGVSWWIMLDSFLNPYPQFCLIVGVRMAGVLGKWGE